MTHLTLAELDAMFDDGDLFGRPEATNVISTAETHRLLDWIAADNDIDSEIDPHDELLLHIHADDGCPHID